jgi:hypothetical protein
VLRIAALALLITVGCAPAIDAAPPEARPLARTGNAWADCYRRFEPTSDAAADVARLGEACAAPAGMHPLASHLGAAQGAGDPAERFTFHARRGCYRAIAVGGPGVRDLDVAVYDPEGRLAAGDVSRDRFPVVPPRGPLCLEREADYTVAVAVIRGRGEYVFQLWGAPRTPSNGAPVAE